MVNPFSFIRSSYESYKTEDIELQSNLPFSQYQTLRKADFYYNSKYFGNEKDSLGRKKPFFNVTKHRVLVAFRATDFDRKDVEVESDDTDTYFEQTRLVQLALNEWLDDPKIAAIKNEVGQTWCKYGGVLVKKTTENGKIMLSVPAWADMVTDQADIVNGIKIERHFYTPDQLMRKGKDLGWDNLDSAMKLAETNQDDEEDDTTRKTPTDYIEVHELHGVLPETVYDSEKTDADSNEYQRRAIIVAGAFENITNDKGDEEESGVILFNEQEKNDPYKYQAYDKQQKRGLGVGVTEDLFEVQQWRNDVAIKMQSALELSSKLVLQAPRSSNMTGKNILTQVKNGSVMSYDQQIGASRLDLTSNSFNQMQSMGEEWNQLGSDITSTHPGITGEQQPSGTPLGSVQIQNIESSSLFDYRREELGALWESIYDDWIVPHIVKKLRTDKKIKARLELEDANALDEALAEDSIMERIAEAEENGTEFDKEVLMNEFDSLVKRLAKQGDVATFNFPDDFLKDVKTRVRVRLTNERRHKTQMLQSLDYALKLYSANPAILQDPNALKMFNKLLQIAGLPPLHARDSVPPVEGAIPSPFQGQLPQIPTEGGSGGIERIAKAQSLKDKVANLETELNLNT